MIGIKNMVIIDDMMCIVKFKLISVFIVIIIVVIVIIIGVVISVKLWKKIKRRIKIISFVVGVEIVI